MPTVTTTMPGPEGFKLGYVVNEPEQLTLRVETKGESGCCPLCQWVSSRVHSRYERRIADWPWHGITVMLEVTTRKFFCDHADCERAIFCERLPEIAAYARKTNRMQAALLSVAFELGGKAGARLAGKLGFVASSDTLLGGIRKTLIAEADEARVLGVDDFAFRKNSSYGTILVDLERHQPVDLLPDRTADTLAESLKGYSNLEIVSRDRSGAYADGIERGAPGAVQVADRWHLLKNLTDTVAQTLERHRFKLPKMQVSAENSQEGPQPYEPMIPRQVANYLGWRWRNGQCDIERLWSEISNSSLPVSREGFEEFMEHLRAGLETPLPRKKKRPMPKYRRPSPREVAWLLTRSDKELSSSERSYLTELQQECPETVEVRRLAESFARMVRDQLPEMFDECQRQALNSQVEEFRSFAASIGKDEAAVRAALSLSWSNGPVEGFIHKLKLLKRQMYGRASFDLLRKRTLQTA